MKLETAYSQIIILKTIMMALIIVWGAVVQVQNMSNQISTASTDIGGVLFIFFSIIYFITSYLLYQYHHLGKMLFIPLVGTFVILGLLTEFYNPNQFSKDIFYLLIFYIISPVFFIAQGIIISFIYFTDLKLRFNN